MTEKHTFQAEIRQLLQILVHSLYKDRDIFLRELVSNASDALNKIQFEMLTNDDVLDADAPLEIHIAANAEDKTIRITDTGIGLTHDEMVQNLGVIAQSGAKSFLDKVDDANNNLATDLIGQFGVGFYSVFMVADRVEVTSRSHLPDEAAHIWISSGEDSFEIMPAEKESRGTEIVVYLRDDAEEFANEWKLRQIITHHSDFVAFPIYVTDAGKEPDEEEDKAAPEPANQRTAIWRRPSSEIEDDEYNNYYRSLTMDFDPPLMRIHAQGDAPIQYYALLYIPKSGERNVLSSRREAGLKLYARKVLIQEYTTDLLPEYLQFVHGVVDSEDLPLNVSRETVQANQQMAKLKQVITRKVLNELKRLAQDDAEAFAEIWGEYSQFLKHGVVSEYSDRERLLPLLRFNTSRTEDSLVTLDDYVEQLESVEGQDAIYYVTADSVSGASRSPHLDPFRARGIEVLYFTESVDGFLATALPDYKDYRLKSVDAADLDLDGVGELSEEVAEAESIDDTLLDQFMIRAKTVLGDAIESVRSSKMAFSGSPVRLLAPEGAMDRHTQRMYQLLDKEFDVPVRMLEVNPRHQIIRNLATRLDRGVTDDALVDEAISLLYENALLADGIHPNPSEMAANIQRMMEIATRLET